jgi:hypothetical protein
MAQSDQATTTDLDEPSFHSDGSAMFLDRQGQPLSIRRFGELFSDPAYKILERTAVANVQVVTAWLGTNQGDAYDDPPLIFGTIVFLGTGFDDSSERFAATEAEALANHAAKVAQLTSPA